MTSVSWVGLYRQNHGLRRQSSCKGAHRSAACWEKLCVETDSKGTDKKRCPSAEHFVHQPGTKRLCFLKTHKDLEELVTLYKSELHPQGRIYIFIDEVQLIQEWEKSVNSYSQDYTEEYELFISGSNSRMLSGELATLLSRAIRQFPIYPFSYQEYTEIRHLEQNVRAIWAI